jgi:preprotein translocase subunit SecA
MDAGSNPERIYTMSLFENVFGSESSRYIKKILPKITTINNLESEFEKLSDQECRDKTVEFKARIASGETLDELLPEAFALVREASRRTRNERPYDVQLMGGIALHNGNIAEMKTGEGKTLVATLPVYLNALVGRGVHVVTVNDYLARRDAEGMGQVYNFLGLTVGVINDQNRCYQYDPSHGEPTNDEDAAQSYKIFEKFLKPCPKQQAYLCDITYGTNVQFGFDFLRDNTQQAPEQLVQRDHYFAIIDEVDSVLIDEARVPMILSAPAERADALYKTCAQIARQLHRETDYTMDEKLQAIQLTDHGITTAEKLLGITNLYTTANMQLVHHIETAVRAQALFHPDHQYVVRNGEVLIVDEFTGRIQEGRRWSDGLHQAIEAKEGVEIKEESRTIASITYQNYFKQYEKIAGMTGTAATSKEEFYKVYGLDVIEIPTHRPLVRRDKNDLIFQTENGKFKALARDVKEVHSTGQPVLIGTASIEKNELLSAYLNNEGIPHDVLNAKNHEREAEIIANAGRKGSVVIATNMAGRGVDIKLGGVPFDQSKYEEILAMGGLHVIGTERHEARRIDNQLRGRAGRQGDPGTTQFYVSLDDSLMRIFGGDKVKSMLGTMGVAEDEPIQNGLISRQLEGAQEKVEGFHFDSRKNILSYDDVLSTQRNVIYGRRKKILHRDQDYMNDMITQIMEFAGDDAVIIEKKRVTLGEEKFQETVRSFALYTTDRLWMDHLEMMDHSRSAVNLRGYGQREPIVEYKREALKLFKQLEQNFLIQMAGMLKNIDTDAILNPTVEQPVRVVMNKADGSKFDRNDKIIVTKDGQTKEVKHKKLDQALAEGWTIQ